MKSNLRILVTGSARSLPLTAVIAHWRNFLGRGAATTTAEAKNADIRQLEAYMRSKKRLDIYLTELNKADLEGFVQQQATKYKPATVNRRISSVRDFCAFAAEQFPEWHNPSSKLRPVRLPDPAPDWFTVAEQEALRTAAGATFDNEYDNARARVILELGMSLGLRCFEISEIAIGSVNLEKNYLENFRRKASRYSSKPIPKLLRDAIEAYLPLRERELTRRCKGYARTSEQNKARLPLLLSFYNADLSWAPSFALDKTSIRRIIKQIGAAAGVKDCRTHRMRHTFCRRMQEKTNKIELTAQLADHQNIATTRRYITASREEIEEALK